jgi:UDP-glucose 4-epimerase
MPAKKKKTPRKKASGKKPGRIIALTGTAGFIGSSLLRSLEGDAKYKKIIALDNRKPPLELKKTKFYRIDLTETLCDSKLAQIFEREQVDTVIHAAFPATPLHNIAYAHELQSVGTMYVLNACATIGVRKVILASTTDVYGAHPSNPNFVAENHPLRGGHRSRFIRDKVDAEKQALRFGKDHPDRTVTILRPCTILGPHIHNFKTTFLLRPAVFTVMGYDPLFQFVHEDDVLQAFKTVINEDHSGTFNIVGPGIMPLSKVLTLTGKIGIPVPSPVLYPLTQLMWYTDIFPAPSSHLDFLKYLCVADGEKAKKKLQFVPKYSTKQALTSFIGAQRVRDIHLSREAV